jgi:hypothetical protein
MLHGWIQEEVQGHPDANRSLQCLNDLNRKVPTITVGPEVILWRIVQGCTKVSEVIREPVERRALAPHFGLQIQGGNAVPSFCVGGGHGVVQGGESPDSV